MKKLLPIILSSLILTTLNISPLQAQTTRDQYGCLQVMDKRIGTKALHLSNCALADEDMPVVAEYLLKHSEINTLYIDNNFITAKGLSVLFKNHPTLTRLDVSNNMNIGDEGATIISELSSLKSLTLTDNEIGQNGAKAISKLPALSSLSISQNEIGDEGLSALANNSNLEFISVSDNAISEKGAIALAKIKKLSMVWIDHNYIGDEGAIALLNNANIDHIAMGSNHITDKTALAIAKTARNLELVDLRNNDITDKGAIALASNATPDSIYILWIQSNLIGQAGVDALNNSQKIDHPSTEGNPGNHKTDVKAKIKLKNESHLKTICKTKTGIAKQVC